MGVGRPGELVCLLLVAACGDNLAPRGSFEIVGHTDLGARGMNSALAVAGNTVYVGSRIDQRGIAIVDVSDPANPQQVGEIAAPFEALSGQSSRELRVVPDLNVLVVLNLTCAKDLHGCSGLGTPEGLDLFDITDPRNPVHVSHYAVFGTRFVTRDPHEFYLYDHRAYLTTPAGPPALDVVDLSNPAAPVSVATADKPMIDILHSVGVSTDGSLGFFSHQKDGLFIDDLATLKPLGAPLTFGTVGPHSAVQAPGRDLLVVTEEVYPMPYGGGCPWGWLRTVDISDPTAPVIAGEFKLPENDPAACASLPANTAFTAHNATVLEDLALVTWYAGGLQAIDISDPAQPRQLAELRPDPVPTVMTEDPALGGEPVEMWSYPVIHDGLIYVVDVRNGLYIVRYHGRWAEQVEAQRFLEGNSNRSN